VRELEHALEHAFVLCRGVTLEARHLPPELRRESGRLPLPQEARIQYESHELRQALERCRWNKARAARDLGISRQTLYRRMKRYGLS
jgi:transcriptional regulator of acetoin/glycerol metabolism